MILGVDIDNTIADTIQLLAQHWTDMGYSITREEMTYKGSYVQSPDGMSQKEREFYWTEGSDWLMGVELFPGAKAIISLLQDHEIHLITARTPGHPKIEAVTKHWLEKIGFEYDTIRHIDGKVEEVEKLGIQVMFEDNPIEAIPIADAGIPVLLKDQSYNQDVDHPLITRFTHWAEVPRLLKQITQ